MAHENTDDVVALFEQEMGRDAAIDPPGHR
jgi:hypothetical protein